MRPITLKNFPEIVDIIMKNIMKVKVCDTKAKIEFDLNAIFKEQMKDIPIPRLIITPEAMCKMQMMVNSVKTEIAWHNLVSRNGNEFFVYDVIAYPQKVNAAHVESSDENYPKWFGSIPDEVAADLRMQGHSHVNFSATPSGPDTAFYEKMLTQVKSWYIFLIMNKDGDMWVNIYDVENNLIYDTQDIDILILCEDGTDMDEWLACQLKHIEKPAEHPLRPTIPASTSKKSDDDEAFGALSWWRQNQKTEVW